MIILLFLGAVSVVVAYFYWFLFGNLSATSVTWVPIRKIPQAMISISNPFSFKLHNQQAASLSGVEGILSSKVKCVVQALWGVPISDLFKALGKDWLILKNEIRQNILLEEKCISRSTVEFEYSCIEEMRVFKPTGVLQGQILGNNMRLLYPLVLFMIKDEDNCQMATEDEVVALINVVHVKDDVVKLETHLINQYLKLSNNNLCCLMILYMPSNADRNSSSFNIADENFCVVCQTNSVTVTCLPCRHVCICQECFQKLEKCPMCRASIQSYFALNEISNIVNDG